MKHYEKTLPQRERNYFERKRATNRLSPSITLPDTNFIKIRSGGIKLGTVDRNLNQTKRREVDLIIDLVSTVRKTFPRLLITYKDFKS